MPIGEDGNDQGLPVWLQSLLGGSNKTTDSPPRPTGGVPEENSEPANAMGGDEEESRPTLGARIAGNVPRPAPAVPPAEVAPQPKFDIDLSKLPPGIAPSMLTPKQVPQPPTGTNNPNLSDLARQQGELGKPLDPSMYKMGTGQRILGTVANFLQGFGGKPFTPTYVGPGATNGRFARDESMRQGNLANVNTQIGTQEKLDTENEKMYRDAIRQAYEGQVGEARKDTAAAQGENAETKRMLEASQAERNQAMADKANAVPSDQRTKDANAQGLTGQARKDYILTGKLPKDFASAGRQPTELEMWRDAFVRDNKRQPTADEIANRKSRTDTKSDQITKDRDTALEKAEAKASDAIGKIKPPNPKDADFLSYLKNPQAWAESKKQEIYSQLEKEKGLAVNDYQERAAQNSKSKPISAAPPAAASAPKPQPKVGTNKPLAGVGDSINFNGKPTKINAVRRNPSTDKYAYQIGDKWYTDDELKPAK